MASIRIKDEDCFVPPAAGLAMTEEAKHIITLKTEHGIRDK